MPGGEGLALAAGLARPSSPTLAVAALVLLAAALHAGWNALAKAIGDTLVAFWLINATVAATGAVLVALLGLPPGAALPFLAGSLLIHVGYNLALLNAYRVADLSQAYPLARGAAPLLVAVVATITIGERLGVAQVLGLVAVAGGLASLGWPTRGAWRAERRGIGLALLTGLAIAGYSITDGLGVRHDPSALGYAGALFLLEGGVLTIVLPLRRGLLGRVRGAGGGALAGGVAAGELSFVAYALVLWAQSKVALATVSALRETSVVMAALFGVVFLGEGPARRRLLAALSVAAGVAVLVVA